MKWTRQQYLELMTFGDAPRPMFSELFGPLVGLDEQWREQGADEREIAMVAFDWDYVPYVDCGGQCGPFGTPEPVVLEDTPEYTLLRDYLGRTAKLCKGAATLPLPLDFPVQTRDDWQRLKPYYVDRPGRVDPAAVERARQLQDDGAMVRARIPGAWDTLRELMGEAQACMDFYLEPDLIRDVLATLRETSVAVLSRVQEELVIDQLFVHEDMAGKSGPLIGPSQVAEFVAPYFRQLTDHAHAHGLQVILHSCGSIHRIIPELLAMGVEALHPLQARAANMDAETLARDFAGRVAFVGGIDTQWLLPRGTPEDVRAEVHRVRRLLGPRFVVSPSHETLLPDVPPENVKAMAEAAREP